jgi:hypothetical protein
MLRGREEGDVPFLRGATLDKRTVIFKMCKELDLQ